VFKKTSNVIIIHFNAGLKDETYLDPITTPEGLQYILTGLIQRENIYQYWMLDNKGNTPVKELFLQGSSQTQECSNERVKPEQLYIAVWTVEVQRSSNSIENDLGCLATSSPISRSCRSAGSESDENVFPCSSVEFNIPNLLNASHYFAKANS